jgi:hypothetical protein
MRPVVSLDQGCTSPSNRAISMTAMGGQWNLNTLPIN